MEFSSPGIAVWRRRFSESSLVVGWLTRERGKVKTSARGALRPGGPLSGRVDLFHETMLRWKESAKGDIHTLLEAEIIDPFVPAQHHHSTLLCAAYFGELSDAVTEPGHPVPEIYDLLKRAMGYLRTHPANERAVEFFEKELAVRTGVLLENSATARGDSPIGILAEYLGRVPATRAHLLSAVNRELSPS